MPIKGVTEGGTVGNTGTPVTIVDTTAEGSERVPTLAIQTLTDPDKYV